MSTYALLARCPRLFFRAPKSATFASSSQSESEPPGTNPTAREGRKVEEVVLLRVFVGFTGRLLGAELFFGCSEVEAKGY